MTFVPCFLWIFLGAPYVETLRSNRALSAALAAISAAVTGVILNLALWFGLHVLFADVGRLIASGPPRQDAGFRFWQTFHAGIAWPAWVTLDVSALSAFHARRRGWSSVIGAGLRPCWLIRAFSRFVCCASPAETECGICAAQTFAHASCLFLAVSAMSPRDFFLREASMAVRIEQFSRHRQPL